MDRLDEIRQRAEDTTQKWDMLKAQEDRRFLLELVSDLQQQLADAKAPKGSDGKAP